MAQGQITMKNIKRKIAYWLSKPLRWSHRKGFGVQSPWAFEFVTHVLFCNSRYYIFDELNGTRHDEQLFRIVNWLNPHDVVANTDNNITKAYLVAPIRKESAKRSDTIIHYYSNNHTKDLKFDIKKNVFYDYFCLIIDGIMEYNEDCWKQIINFESSTSIFDMGNRGIVFFDPKRQKQIYYI